MDILACIKEASAKNAARDDQYDREKELKAFDDSKAGVKGLIDAAGVMTKIPKIFIRPPEDLAEDLFLNSTTFRTDLQVPMIDLIDVVNDVKSSDRRKEVIDQVRLALAKWGFFQLINHGIPSSVLDGMISGTRAFHEQDSEVKTAFYTRDLMKAVRFESNVDLYVCRNANWRDTLSITFPMSENDLHLDELPTACRNEVLEYIKHITKLGETLFELISEALGLKRDHLKTLECGRRCVLLGHYYPACPEPELTLGGGKHTDASFITILLQDQIGGLQVMHGNQWVNVQPIAGGLVVNVGNLLQMVSNDKCVSVKHRVQANHVGPRISVACFFSGVRSPSKFYGPVEELLSEENPPIYRKFTMSDYIAKHFSMALDDQSRLDKYFKLESN